MSRQIILATLTLLLCGGTLKTSLADVRCESCPFTCSQLGLGHKDCSYYPSDSDGICCVDLTDAGNDVAEATEDARNGGHDDEECPSGFEEREQSCTQAERDNGCRDIRLDSGKGCVSL